MSEGPVTTAATPSAAAAASSASVRRPSLWARLLPIVLFEAYLALSVAVFATGPWQWPVKDPWKLYGFLLSAHLALLLGYLWGVRRRPGGAWRNWAPAGMVLWGSLAGLLLLLPTLHSRTGSAWPNLAAALEDPGKAYVASNQVVLSRTDPVEYVRVVLAPFLAWVLPLTVFYWRRLGWPLRALGTAAIVAGSLLAVTTGTNKGLGDIMLVVPVMILAGHLSGVSRIGSRRFLVIAALVIAMAGGFLAFFTAGQLTRGGGRASIRRAFPAFGVVPSENNWMIRGLPDRAQDGALALSMYVGHGYFGLSLALDKPWKPTWGFGNSLFLIHEAERFVGEGTVLQRTYPGQTEDEGWEAKALWPTIYPWIASDVSFPGTVVVVFVIGYLFGLSWVDSLQGTNPFAVAMLSFFVIMISYFPANNQVLQNPDSFVAFFVTLLLWAASRRRPTIGRGRA